MGVMINRSNTQFVIDNGDEIDRIWLDDNWKVVFDHLNYQKALPLIKSLRAKLHQANRHLENIFIYDININNTPEDMKNEYYDHHRRTFITRIATESLVLLLDSTKDILAKIIVIVYGFELKDKEICFSDFFPLEAEVSSWFDDLKTVDSTLAEYLAAFNRSEENKIVTSYCSENLPGRSLGVNPFTPGYSKKADSNRSAEVKRVNLESLSNANVAIKIEKTYRISICAAGQLMLNYLHYKPILANYFVANTMDRTT